ncbi:HNH endonuclease, partial [Xanthomonas oryzae pv. oryzae]
ANGAGDPRAYEVVSALLSARLARWRAPPVPTP